MITTDRRVGVVVCHSLIGFVDGNKLTALNTGHRSDHLPSSNIDYITVAPSLDKADPGTHS